MSVESPDVAVAVPDTTTPIVCMRSVDIGYGGNAVVKHLNFDIHPGDVIAVLGANGSGKSTVVRGFLGLAQILDGTITLFGHRTHLRDNRHLIGYVPQRHTLDTSIPVTVSEVVTSGLTVNRPWYKFVTSDDRRKVQQAIEMVELGPQSKRRASELSGGQQRRLLIARALVGSPKLLVMDEPTAGVDADSQRRLVQTLTKLADSGITMLIVSHEVAPLAPLVNRAVVISQGRKTYDGPLEPAMLGAQDGLLDLGEHHHHPDEHREAEGLFMNSRMEP